MAKSPESDVTTNSDAAIIVANKKKGKGRKKVEIRKSDVTTNSDAAIVANNKKKGKGRKKVEIRKIENRAQRHVTFSKRKDGLLKKSADLSKLTGVDVATIVVSSIGKVFCFGSPTLDTVLNRYLGQTSRVGVDSAAVEDRGVQDLMEAKRLLEVEKNNNNVIISDNCGGGGWWWERPVEVVPVEDIEVYEAALLRLKYNIEEVRRNQMNYIWEDNYNNYSMYIGMEDGVLDC